MNENTYWVTIWITVALVVICGTSIIGGCTAYESYLVREMVVNGADPIAARCAISPANVPLLCAIKVVK